MAQQILNIGNNENDRQGDPARLAFSKIKSNFAELYAGAGAGSGAFDNTGTTLVSTTIQAAIVELSAKIDAINAVLS